MPRKRVHPRRAKVGPLRQAVGQRRARPRLVGQLRGAGRPPFRHELIGGSGTACRAARAPSANRRGGLNQHRGVSPSGVVRQMLQMLRPHQPDQSTAKVAWLSAPVFGGDERGRRAAPRPCGGVALGRARGRRWWPSPAPALDSAGRVPCRRRAGRAGPCTSISMRRTSAPPPPPGPPPPLPRPSGALAPLETVPPFAAPGGVEIAFHPGEPGPRRRCGHPGAPAGRPATSCEMRPLGQADAGGELRSWSRRGVPPEF